MSERKTTEAKVRCSPSEKADWQRAAAEADMGLSEWLRRLANDGAAQKSGLLEFISTNVDASGTLTKEALERAAEQLKAYTPAPFTGTPTPVDELEVDGPTGLALESRVIADQAVTPACDKACRPWEFCACRSGE